MSATFLARLCIALLAISLSPAVSHRDTVTAHPAARPHSGAKDKKDKKKDDEESDDLRDYQKIKTYSEQEYAKNPDFRAEVDAAFRELQRDHSDYAFTVNARTEFSQIARNPTTGITRDQTLYSNPLVQDYVNRLGHSLVPKDSTHLFAFRVLLDPIPEARALSTGTVYVSTGLLAIVDNEAQLAYVLGHEIAHVEKEHWREDILVQHGLDRYNRNKGRERTVIGGIASFGARMFGAGGTLVDYVLVPSVVKIAVADTSVSWDKKQEDEADELGLKYMFARNYDPREVPKFFAAMQDVTHNEQRATLGFMAEPQRVVERSTEIGLLIPQLGSLRTGLLVGSIQALTVAASPSSTPPPAAQQNGPGKTFGGGNLAERGDAAQQALDSKMATDLQTKLDTEGLVGSGPEFEAAMAEIKRDNGIRALSYDMFWVARSNLEESIRIRSNDPYAHYYFGKVLKLTARNRSDKMLALAEFAKAISLDKRHVLADPYLHRALATMELRDQSAWPEIISDLKTYIHIYQRMSGGQVPPEMDAIYDYLQEVGELGWSVAPVEAMQTAVPIQNTTGPVTAPAPAAAPAKEVEPQRPARGSRRRKP